MLWKTCMMKSYFSSRDAPTLTRDRLYCTVAYRASCILRATWQRLFSFAGRLSRPPLHFRSCSPWWRSAPALSGRYERAANPRHILFLLGVVALIFFGASRIEVVAALSQPHEVLYLPYAIMALSHVIFILPFIRPAGRKELPVSA